MSETQNPAITIPAGIATALDAYATSHGMTRETAAAALLTDALRIADAAAVLDTVGRLTIESLYSDAEDASEAWDLAHADPAAEFGAVESHPARPYTITIGAILDRGHWIVTEERIDGNDYKNATQTMTVAADLDAAVQLYIERLTELTDALWTAEDETPLWFDGVTGDHIGYGDAAQITWRGLLPAAAVGAE